jgi:hypothetical protein
LANDLARRASMTAFLCFVVAHLECPDMPVILRVRRGERVGDEPNKVAVKSQIA